MLNFNAILFCNDYSIPYSSKISRNFINVNCKFCNDTSFHLGINCNEGYATCFRCGWHSLDKTIISLINVNFQKAKEIIKKYSKEEITIEQKQRKNIPSKLILPSEMTPLTTKAKKYLINRKFDPDKLASIWGLLSTPHFGEYKNRIFAPIYYEYQMVSYQTRSISNNKNILRYLACHQEEEIIQHQHCVYGLDQATERGKTCLVVEGVTDVWRLGPGTIAVFGISFTKQQAQLIAKNFNKVFTMFDSEIQAQEQAEELGFLIASSFTNPVEIINLPFLVPEIDPGDLPQDTADEIVKEIGL